MVYKLIQLLGFFLWLSSQGWASGLAMELEGPLQQGGLVKGWTEPGARVFFDGRQVEVSEEGLFLIGFGRDAKPRSTLKMIAPDGSSKILELKIAQRHYQIQRIEGLPPRKVTPRAEDLARIHKEAILVAKARERSDPRTDFLSGFIWPVQGEITGVYGSQRILNGKPRRPHYGIDIAAPRGTIVQAPAGGTVTLAYPDMFFSGGTLIIDHGHGLSSTFLHLSRILVSQGEQVEQGDPIAEVGATGRVTGAHLDWRINLFQTRLDPQLLVGPMPMAAR